jgi:acetate kinase
MLERIRHRIFQRLCDEEARLDRLVSELLGADLNAAATYAQLHLLGHRVVEAATAYDSPPMVKAAKALEAAAIDAIEKHSNNLSEPVWQAIGSLSQLLPSKARSTER